MTEDERSIRESLVLLGNDQIAILEIFSTSYYHMRVLTNNGHVYDRKSLST